MNFLARLVHAKAQGNDETQMNEATALEQRTIHMLADLFSPSSSSSNLDLSNQKAAAEWLASPAIWNSPKDS